MTREHVVMVLGLLVLISPWSGLPMAWLEWILLIIGLAIIALSYSRVRTTQNNPPPAPPLPLHEESRPRSSPIAFS